jgi:hypothetical protein
MAQDEQGAMRRKVETDRWVVGFIGVFVLVAVSHKAITAEGGYSEPGAWLIITGALAIAAAAIILAREGFATRVGFGAIIALVAAELLFGARTVERVIVTRDEQQAPIRAALARRDAIVKEIKELEQALPRTTPRLDKAEVELAKANDKRRDDAAKKECAVNCKELLSQGVADAKAEVDSARKEYLGSNAAALQVIGEKRAELVTLKVPASATPLADRIGAPGWAIDLAFAVLQSLSSNLMAVVLIAYAAHGRSSGRKVPSTQVALRDVEEPAPLVVVDQAQTSVVIRDPVDAVSVPPPPVQRVERKPRSQRLERAEVQRRGMVDDFLFECIGGGDDEQSVGVTEMWSYYEAYCRARGLVALAKGDFVDDLVRAAPKRKWELVKTADRGWVAKGAVLKAISIAA